MYLYIRHEKKQTLARAIAFHRKQLVVTQLNEWRRMVSRLGQLIN